MAVRNGTAEWTDYLARTTYVPAFNNPFTFQTWFRIVTNPGSYAWADLVSIRNEPAGTFFHEELGVMYIPGTGALLYTRSRNDSAVAEILGSTALSTNTWYCAAFVNNSDTDRRVFLGSLTSPMAQDGINTTDSLGEILQDAAQLAIAEARSGVMRVGNTKVWATNLTLAQLQAEQYVMRPVERTNFYAWLPFLDTGTNRGKDYAGNGNFTTNGTMTDEDNPPVSYGAPAIFFPWVSSSPAGISGSLSATLGTMTASASGAVAIQGTTSATLGALTDSASGTVAVKGSLSATLGTMTASASGAVAVKGTTNVTLEEMHHTLAGAVAVKGTTSTTLGTLALAAAGAVGSTPITGQANITLGGASLSAAGAVAIKGSTSQTLGGLTLASTGTVLIAGQASSTLGAIALSASGTVGFLPVIGSLNVTLPDDRLDGVGRVALRGQVAATLGALTDSASGKVAVKGSLAATLGVLALSAMGMSLAPGVPDEAYYTIPFEDWTYKIERDNWTYQIPREDWSYQVEG